VHRDISPQNLVISFEGVVKVVDFGIARAEMRETKTKAGTIKGKFAYMSPEQCVATNVDRRTDVFALGVIVHELLTGRRLFKRNSPYETYQAVIECAVPVPSTINHELDPALDEIVMKAVAKDKEDRWPNAEAFGDAMLKYLHHRGKGSGPNEIAKWFEEHFTQEIEEHGERMRELISGRAESVDTGMGWDDDEDKRKNETVDLRGDSEEGEVSVSLHSQDIEMVRQSEASLESFVGRLSTEEGEARSGVINASDDDEVHDDDDGPPPEKTRIEANPLEKLKEMEEAARKTPVPVPTGSVTGGPAPLPAPPTGPQKQISGRDSGRAKFPDAANVPTVIAEDGVVEPQRSTHPELAPTAAAVPIDPLHGIPPVGPYSRTQDAVSQAQVNAALSAMDAQRKAATPTQPPPQGQPQGQPMHGYPVMPGGRPFSSDLAPSNPPHRHSGPFDPNAAANMMSPVGDHYPQTDWAAAAARPARALQPWQLALLFVGALGAALLVTIIIAKLARGG
jgi:serine/threonine-protein kinase